MSADEPVKAFRDSVTSIFLSEHDFIDWDAVNAGVEHASGAANHLEVVRQKGPLSVETLAAALKQYPSIYQLALSLIAFNSSGSQVSKWGLSASVPNSSLGREHLSRQLLHIGLGKVLATSAPVVDLLKIAEVYKDSFRRRFRSGDRYGVEVNRIIRTAVRNVAEELKLPLEIRAEALADSTLRRSLDYVVALAERPIVGISTVFQNQSGGRQQRDLSVTYPILQQKLSEYGMGLVLIADGQGIAEASDRTLLQLFDSVRFPMTMKQAQDGGLRTALMTAANEPPPESLDAAAVSRLIGTALDAQDSISVDELPLAQGPAVLALARYAESHRNLALSLSTSGTILGWTHPERVELARRLASRFDGKIALDLFAQCIGSNVDPESEQGVLWGTISTPDSPPFTGKMLIAANGSGLSPDARKIICRHALEYAPGSAFAVLMSERDLSTTEIESHRKRQAVLPVNVVVCGPRVIRQITRAANPIEVLNKIVLDQSDLTKVSPFILSNATPTRMFFGRAAEAATILATVATNSVALLGSRRIGKTSLLRHVREELAEANFLPYFGDCQTVKTWDDFAELARTEWGLEPPPHFRPQHLTELMRALKAGSDKPVVVLLDEIDQLLDWDRTHTDDSVPEAFFRACRSLSQEGVAQFVFSGERTIAQRIWDPQSPHWNFCRPLPLAQLTKEAATALLIQPLKAIGIQIANEVSFADESWRLTSGHPQIVQHLGDRLVRRLDAQSKRDELRLSIDDIIEVAQTYEFAEHYLNTYWGQANVLERQISLIIAESPLAPGELLSVIRRLHSTTSEEALQGALRMLQLYGVVIEKESEIQLRAEWFNEAQSFFGDGNAAQLSEDS